MVKHVGELVRRRHRETGHNRWSMWPETGGDPSPFTATANKSKQPRPHKTYFGIRLTVPNPFRYLRGMWRWQLTDTSHSNWQGLRRSARNYDTNCPKQGAQRSKTYPYKTWSSSLFHRSVYLVLSYEFELEIYFYFLINLPQYWKTCFHVSLSLCIECGLIREKKCNLNLKLNLLQNKVSKELLFEITLHDKMMSVTWFYNNRIWHLREVSLITFFF